MASKEEIEKCENCVYYGAHSHLCDSCGFGVESNFKAADFVFHCENCAKLETENKRLKEELTEFRRLKEELTEFREAEFVEYIKVLQAKNEQLTQGLRDIRKSNEIMEARRIAMNTLKG